MNTSHRRFSRSNHRSVSFFDACTREVQGNNEMVKLKGYTKAVDMWSLGCIAVAMLMGSTPFDILRNFNEARSIGDAPRKVLPEYSLIGLYNRSEWVQLNYKAKDFVKRLLILDEMTRMTAQEALNHEMFTNECDKESFDNAYKKAVQGWKPLKPPVDIVEEIFPRVESKKLLKDVRQLTSQWIYFAVSDFEKQYPTRKPKVKALKPIEPHFQPRHKNVDYFVSPHRSRITLPAIREVTEEAQVLISTVTESESVDARSNASPCCQSLIHSTDLELPAVETLRLTEEIHNLIPSAHKPFLGRASREDLLAKEMNWTTHKLPDVIHEDGIGFEPRGMESSNLSVLRENMSKCNYSLQSNNFDSQKSLSQASNLMVTELPRWPLHMNLETYRTTYDVDEGRVPQTRKRLRTYDLNMDENLETQTSTMSTQIQNDTFSNSFTSINRRKSMKLDDGQGEETASRLSGCQSSAKPGEGHDGPLISKRVSEFEPCRAALLGSVRLAERLGSEDELTSPQPGIRCSRVDGGRTAKRNNSSFYDYEEASIYAEAGMESRHFRTARSYGEAVSRRKGEKPPKASNQSSLRSD